MTNLQPPKNLDSIAEIGRQVCMRDALMHERVETLSGQSWKTEIWASAVTQRGV